jgi:hypothetical protein
LIINGLPGAENEGDVKGRGVEEYSIKILSKIRQSIYTEI